MRKRPHHLRTQSPAKDAPVVNRRLIGMRSSCMLYTHPSDSISYRRAFSIAREERDTVPGGLSGTRST